MTNPTQSSYSQPTYTPPPPPVDINVGPGGGSVSYTTENGTTYSAGHQNGQSSIGVAKNLDCTIQ